MNGVSGAGTSPSPYVPKDDDEQKKAAAAKEAPRPAPAKVDNPVNAYTRAERLADAYDLCAVHDALPCNKKAAAFFKALAHDHRDVPVKDKVVHAAKEAAKEQVVDWLGDGVAAAAKKAAQHFLKLGTPVGIAIHALEKAEKLAEKGSAVLVKTEAGLKAGAPAAAAAGERVAAAALETAKPEAAMKSK